MIFEQAYGAWLVKEMNRRIRKFDEDLICKRYDDVAYKPLAGDPNSVAVIVTGGNAQRSSVRGLDYNVLPLSVMVMCREQCSTAVRNAIDAIQEEYNAVPLILDYYDSAVAAESRSAKDNYESNVRTNVKSTFTTPFMLLENDYKTTNETIKACFISFSASVTYGKSAIVEAPTSALLIDGKEYAIEHILAYTFSVQPSYDTSLPQGSELARQTKLSRANAYSFTVSKTAGDELQEIFYNEIMRLDGGLAGRTLKAKIGNNTINVQTYDLTEAYTGGNAAAYTLVLGV